MIEAPHDADDASTAVTIDCLFCVRLVVGYKVWLLTWAMGRTCQSADSDVLVALRDLERSVDFDSMMVGAKLSQVGLSLWIKVYPAWLG